MNNNQIVRMYNALKRISQEYQTTDQLRRSSRGLGPGYEESLEMAYENIQEEAKLAIKGVRISRPKAKEKKVNTDTSGT